MADQDEPFLTLRDRVACLVNATILLPVSVFIVAITIRNVATVSGLINLYILGVKCSSAVLSIITAILCCFVSLTSPRRNFSLVAMLFGILAAFGALFALATIFFNAHWTGHWEALQRMVFVLAAILNLICTVIITILLARRFQNPVFEDPPMGPSNGSTRSGGGVQQSCLARSSTILAALVLISGITGLAGFSLGFMVNWKLIRETELLGGGLHSGFLASLTGILYLSALYGCKRYPESTISSSLITSILSLIGASISYYTEELEFVAGVNFIDKEKPIFTEIPEYKYALLAKSSVVIFASVFTIVFGTPLTACICCLLRGDVLKFNQSSPPLQGESSLWLPPRSKSTHSRPPSCNAPNGYLGDRDREAGRSTSCPLSMASVGINGHVQPPGYRHPVTYMFPGNVCDGTMTMANTLCSSSTPGICPSEDNRYLPCGGYDGSNSGMPETGCDGGAFL